MTQTKAPIMFGKRMRSVTSPSGRPGFKSIIVPPLEEAVLVVQQEVGSSWGWSINGVASGWQLESATAAAKAAKVWLRRIQKFLNKSMPPPKPIRKPKRAKKKATVKK